MSTETACTHCEAATATKHTEPDSPHDPLCQTCYDATWTVCDYCGEETRKDDITEYCEDRGTRDQPPSYADRCPHCAPSASEPDYDAINDERNGR